MPETTPLLPNKPPSVPSGKKIPPLPPPTIPSSSQNNNTLQKIQPLQPTTKIGPQRTSRTTQKLKLLPEEPSLEEDEESGREVYSQVTRIKETSARKDAERLGKSERALLPRVTAYCTASSYRMKEMVRWLNDRKKKNHTWPKLIDECLYTPFKFHKADRTKKKIGGNNNHDDLIRLDEEGGEIDLTQNKKDVFLFEYGVVVLWGFKQEEESKFLTYLEKFEKEKLAEEDIQIEEFNYYITKSYQPRIYNDFITLRDGNNYMMKLSISHAIAQSTKISLFEELVDNTIEDTQDIPQQIALVGKVDMKRSDIMKSIGELFILRININLHGSVLDSPELMWSEPHLEPIYQATRGYLEINQRVDLLNQRLEVISDLLQMLKEQLGHSHEEYLEVIVIVLIAVEVIVSIVNIFVDILADF
ncbi:Rmd1 protein [Saccharomycopsis crataegensis]|uniref:Rmd1 protein n=1 Tax=Saccharomycopsis crataegensis TaxID=43959 RepID=A0AAV5QDJ5_9ASCO|nr:Rmd1 protein [Saccharomycopsis crataegensis]